MGKLKHIKLDIVTNEEITTLRVRPNYVIAWKPYGDSTKILISNYQHWVAVNKPVEEIDKVMENASVRRKVSKVPDNKGNTERD